MTDAPFGRQPKPVKVTLEGDQIDIEYYLYKLTNAIERNSYDSAVRHNNTFTIYPRAVND
jgi:hypothetical protein